eukprot:TRINITY_DN96442_c0_g1_i1.p1 TRINITY_DN96442_c0_g1~~TRINITY_DN96442_c0_g1_i1.p1  ORF type:complete len:635 (-),score=162.55 TRINITY_DN96442_c0_g1_i1:64-1968(-)
MGAACARRRPQQTIAEDGEVPFWEELDKSRSPATPVAAASGEASQPAASAKESKESAIFATHQGATAESDEPKDEVDLPGYEQADHLKCQGKDKFARGDVSEAVTCWMQALDSLPPPSGAPGALLGLMPGLGPQEEGEKEDRRILEMRVALLLNLALAHSKLKKFRQAVGFCDEALVDEPNNVKALYRKADALGELCDWQEAEEAAAKLQTTGEEGAKLAAQKREEWRRRRRQADGKQKKMWSAALEKDKSGKAESKIDQVQSTSEPAEEAWVAPKVEMMSPFDLRKKCIQWQEDEDFSDQVWKESLGRKEASFYQKRALPLTLLAGASLAELQLPKLSELVVHCILDGNMAPFAEPHDWSVILRRCPEVRSLLVVYIDIGSVGQDKDGNPPQPYGTLLRPTEEGRVGDRVARAARFMGTYQEFKNHCQDLPGLVRPNVALWADVPLYGFHADDFETRLQAFSMLSADGVPSVLTQGGEVQEPGGMPLALRMDEQANLSVAIAAAGIGLHKLAAWHWNRFIVPLDRGPQGIIAAHALLGVLAPGSKKCNFSSKAVKVALKRRAVTLTPYKLPNAVHPHQRDKEFAELRDRQWEAFCQHLRAQGRTVAGPTSSQEEMRRQSMEWYKFVGGNGMEA